MTYAEFLQEAAATALLHKEWRWGQTLYNCLRLVNPDLTAHVLTDAQLDPFYNDANVPAFLAWLEQAWQEFTSDR